MICINVSRGALFKSPAAGEAWASDFSRLSQNLVLQGPPPSTDEYISPKNDFHANLHGAGYKFLDHRQN